MDLSKSLREQTTPRDAEVYARWLLWHDGYSDALLGCRGKGTDGAVVVEEHDGGWAVYRRRGAEREAQRVHPAVGAAYDDAVEWIFEICRDEGL